MTKVRIITPQPRELIREANALLTNNLRRGAVGKVARPPLVDLARRATTTHEPFVVRVSTDKE